MSACSSCRVAAALVLIAGSLGAQTPGNLGFEAHASGRASGWYTGGNGYEVVVDSVGALAGRFSLRTRWVDAAPHAGEGSQRFAVATQGFPVARAMGRKLHLTGYIRTENVQAGYAGFWMRVDGAGQSSIAFDNMMQRGVRGTTPWTRYDIELPVDSGAVNVVFGAIHPGNGTAWFDSLTVEVVGDPMPRQHASAGVRENLGFESHTNGRPATWGSGGNGYEILVDSVGALAGRFSLRTRWIDPAPFAEGGQRFAVASQGFPVNRAAGRKLHLTGYIRTERIQTGYAGLWMRVDGPGQRSIAFDNMMQRGVRGTTPWTRYDIELPVDSGAVGVIFGVIHPGDGTAWFDSLTVDVVGAPMPRTVASFRPEPRPAEDLTRLLTDAELAPPRDSIDVPEDSAYAAWVKTNARPIRSLGATDFSDLKFFAPLLRDKRIVQLGESGHGVAEFNMAKVRLIKYLHEELGYDVMAFESSTFECERAQKNIASLTSTELMRACIFGVWHAEETVPLFEYIKQTQSTRRPLILAGFDEQTSSMTANARPGVFRSAVAVVDSAYARHVHETDSVFLVNRNATSGYVAANKDRLVAFYDSLAQFLRTHRRRIEAAHPGDPNIAVITRQAAVSMTFFVRQLAAGPSGIGTDIRDLGMADNLDFLLDELYPGKKVIVWAHNFHIQHRENTRAVTSNAPRAGTLGPSADTTNRHPKTMGEWVAQRHRKELYTIGLFMYRGSAAMNNRQPYQIAQSRTGSLESILHRAPWKYSYVDFSQAKQTRGNEWMWKPLTWFAWGTNPERFVPRDEYDGVLFIDKVHVPNYR